MKTIIGLIKKLLRKSKAKKAAIDSRYIIPRNKHHVSKTEISENALKVLNRLNSAGYQAYLVGGSVRDLLLRQSPKDFDIATSATPQEVRKLFRNARVIGKRFKLVHILYHREIIEVATFRGHEAEDDQHQINDRGMVVRDNVYGTLEEDAWRRDFTVNSLYYNLVDSSIVDFTGGTQDIEKRKIVMIGAPTKRYQEDPVRMLRAIRFAAKLHFDIDTDTAKPLKELCHLINDISGSRLFDEMIKFYQCGQAEKAQKLLLEYGLFDCLFPLCAETRSSATYPDEAFIAMALRNTDARLQAGKPVNPAFVFAVLLWFPLLRQAAMYQAEGMPPLPAIEMAMSYVIAEQNKIVTIPKRHAQVIREIWIMQYRFPRRLGNRAFQLLAHPRFRAAYDFLALRALIGDESVALADWWTLFQDVEKEEQERMVELLKKVVPATSKKRKKSPPKQ